MGKVNTEAASLLTLTGLLWIAIQRVLLEPLEQLTHGPVFQPDPPRRWTCTGWCASVMTFQISSAPSRDVNTGRARVERPIVDVPAALAAAKRQDARPL